ncbi:MAG: DNA topoisomerase I [Candidatus Portnoybacteria bacterium RBG_19FT_COMBO_36_7]|uniref:DNA topoisomerase 1 n=1 Tax=Candidatus Portnoybacteria bacterium RBG_19FT_COMBO_36_7 TaxID=1801992 RepID=A0A1G2F5P2_9BACT|nr:MAG: DNA topoisomerase I [Candidatus Portnoybacteria bacterium RBG_19FT_COMBO_36_7]
MNLIIVESPTKARTIAKFLNKEYSVLSSYGHIRDLPRKELGIDVENNFEPKYVVPLVARKRLTPIKKSLQKASKIILATDEDREGEAIAWHLAQVLGLTTTDDRLSPEKAVDRSRSPVDVQRIVFHEITKSAIEEALKNPRQLDMDLVDAQQARRVLDRLVGYKLSPFLWKKIAKGLSAGRVQSVAVRLIVEREREIKDFKPEEYWSIEAMLRKFPISNFQFPNKSQNPNHKTETQENKEFIATLIKKGSETIGKFDIKTKENADKILKDLEGAKYQIAEIEKKETNRNPLPAFTTSTMQQEAWQKLHFSAKLTMSLAQTLYENGLITYHRTDSLNLSEQSLFAAKKFIIENYGEKYWAGYLRKFKTKSKGAQEAHEAIRPTDPDVAAATNIKTKLDYSKHSEENIAKLYNLIWKRFIASQMAQAVFDSTTVDIAAKDFIFRASGQMLKFDGFLKIYPMKFKEADLPPLQKDEVLDLKKLMSAQHFTQPPARYSEATLIKVLEENGIGRPSTYAPIISTIQDRNYVQKDEKRKFFPTDIGFSVNDMLVEHFPEIVDLKFTALIEEELDHIAEGQKKWQPVIKEFYDPFSAHLAKKYEEVEKQKPEPEPTDKTCPKCGKPLVIRTSRFGRFYACSDFPKCRHTESIANSTGITCPECGQGHIHEKRTRRGKIFYACSIYPDCKFALWDKPTGQMCPQCGLLLITTKNGTIKCSDKKCGYQEKRKASV